MATLRPIEERDAKDNTTRINTSVVFTQGKELHIPVSNHAYNTPPNPDYHPPITVQDQDGKLVFFEGLPWTSAQRRMAKEISLAEVPAYIVEQLQRNPLKVRVARPSYHEVRLAVIGDQEVVQVEEHEVAPGTEAIDLVPAPAGAPLKGAPLPTLQAEATE
jgi:hypothetical protein